MANASVSKKTAHASEQDREEVKQARAAWALLQPSFDPAKLVFLDETGVSTKMARLRGRSPNGERCRASVPHGHWKTTTLVAGLRLGGITAPGVVDGAMDGELFTLYAEHFLAPTLSEGDWSSPGIVDSYALDISSRSRASFSYLMGERYPRAECRRPGLYQPSMNSKIAIRSSAIVRNLRRSRSSHSRVAKKLSHIALS